ncbi:MAG: acyltransferase [Chlorobiaceae bacterium]|nr:acyltransferase [Chlorobiaceae bacterium]
MESMQHSPAQPCLLKQHNAALDGLRGIAVSLVFLFHADIPGFSGGFIGVDIFFVLSGFLITILLLQENRNRFPSGLGYFYMRRILRLMPGLVFMLLTFLAFSIFYFRSPNDIARQFQDAMIALFYSSNWTRALGLHRPEILGHTWSLAIEEQFYLLWPILLMIISGLSMRYRSFVIGISLALSWGWRVYLLYAGASWDRLYNGLDCRADMLLTGCLLASLLNAGALKSWKQSRLVSSATLSIALFTVAIMANKADWQQPPLYIWQFGAAEFATALIILELVSVPEGILSSILSAKPLAWLGSISYGIYLWHYPILWFLQKTPFSKPQQAVLAALLTLGFSLFSWRLIERPFLRLKERFRRQAP